ncbi:hypothetical protein [Comamonas odontotermitis]|uniref:hypothetical protein n=1 Tax=Comamonas odontotermitis TaxID=379895 RepID=UPI001CC83005|nr:hypothetical protein [Comamonas odontotermitis]UBB16167.1 hypothetical protein LAD35_15250 [Comamonas odontotermitis]
MEAIIAHPAKGAKRSPARKTAVKPAPATTSPKNEAEVLQEAALQILMFMGSEIANADLDGLGNAKEIAIGVDGIVYSILNPDPADSHSFDVLDDLITIRHQLSNLSACLEGATGLRVAAAVFAAGLVLQADQYAERLHAAIFGLPATLEDLRALTTFAGVRPFRDRPTPPIRRIQPGTGEKTPAQLMRVLQFAAEQAGNANDILMMLQAIPKLSHEVYVLINSAQAITQYVGAAADDALGGDISGDFEHWTYGPNFADAGKGV